MYYVKPEKKGEIMEGWQKRFWQLRLENCKSALEKNNFAVFIAESCAEARTIFNNAIFPIMTVRSASWGDSMSMHATGILDDLKKGSP